MMYDFTIGNIKRFEGKEVKFGAWIFNKREKGSIIFLILRDGSGYVQAVVIKGEVNDDIFLKAKDLNQEASVIVCGKVKKEERSQGGFELNLTGLEIVQNNVGYPIAKKDHGPDFLLSNRHLWLRSKKQWAIQRIRNTVIYAIYMHLNSEGYLKIDAPILTPNACEGTTTLFPVPYLPAWNVEWDPGLVNKYLKNDDEFPFSYLSQSGQLYLEAAIYAHGKVFDFGPVFRAEKSKTRRHLTEFWMMDAETAFANHSDNIKIQEKLIVKIIEQVLDTNEPELAILGRDTDKLAKIVEGNFPVMDFSEALEILEKKGYVISKDEDLGAEHETVISNLFDKPVFIERYPKRIKAFYMKEDPKDGEKVLCSDMLAPEGYGEISGGSQREEEYDKLLERIREHKLKPKDFSWYLDLRKYGSVPHSGFGIGLERLTAWISGLEHVRETIPFPRMIDRFKP